MAFLGWFKKKEVKWCKDCKYLGVGTWPDCLHPKSLRDGKLDYVTGLITGTSYRSCNLMRDSFFPCGKKAKLFEPKL